MAAAVGSLRIRQHLEAGDAARLERRLPLMFVEVGGHGDDGILDRLAQQRFGILLERAEDEARKFFRRKDVPARSTGPIVAHLPLEGAAQRSGCDHLKILGRLADQEFALASRSPRRKASAARPSAFGINSRPLRRHVGRRRVRRA